MSRKTKPVVPKSSHDNQKKKRKKKEKLNPRRWPEVGDMLIWTEVHSSCTRELAEVVSVQSDYFIVKWLFTNKWNTEYMNMKGFMHAKKKDLPVSPILNNSRCTGYPHSWKLQVGTELRGVSDSSCGINRKITEINRQSAEIKTDGGWYTLHDIKQNYMIRSQPEPEFEIPEEWLKSNGELKSKKKLKKMGVWAEAKIHFHRGSAKSESTQAANVADINNPKVGDYFLSIMGGVRGAILKVQRISSQGIECTFMNPSQTGNGSPGRTTTKSINALREFYIPAPMHEPCIQRAIQSGDRIPKQDFERIREGRF